MPNIRCIFIWPTHKYGLPFHNRFRKVWLFKKIKAHHFMFLFVGLRSLDPNFSIHFWIQWCHLGPQLFPLWTINGWNLKITWFEKENHLNQAFHVAVQHVQSLPGTTDCDTFPPVLVELKSRPKRGTGWGWKGEREGLVKQPFFDGYWTIWTLVWNYRCATKRFETNTLFVGVSYSANKPLAWAVM